MTTDRRSVLGAGLCLPLIGLQAVTAQQAGFQPKTTVAYQDQPKEGKRCGGCRLFRPAANDAGKGACIVVAGPVSAQGWCVLFEAKA